MLTMVGVAAAVLVAAQPAPAQAQTYGEVAAQYARDHLVGLTYGFPGFDMSYTTVDCSSSAWIAWNSALPGAVPAKDTNDMYAYFLGKPETLIYVGTNTLSATSLLPGDLLFWDISSSSVKNPDHVAIYLGDNQILQTALGQDSTTQTTRGINTNQNERKPYAVRPSAGGGTSSGDLTGATTPGWNTVALANNYISTGNFAIATKPGVRYAFWRGADGRLQQGTWNGSAWSVYSHTFNAGSATYPNLSVAVNSSGWTSVAWRSSTSTIGLAYWGGSSWIVTSVPTQGHSVESDVALVERAGKRDVFWRGEGGQLYQATWNGSSWVVQVPAVSLAVHADSGLAAVADSTGATAVAWKRSATSFGFSYWNGAKWATSSVWTGAGNASITSNIALDDRSGTRDVFWRGADGLLYQATFNGASWSIGSRPVQLGTASNLQLSASTSATGATSVSWNQGDGTMGIAYWDGSQWVTKK